MKCPKCQTPLEDGWWCCPMCRMEFVALSIADRATLVVDNARPKLSFPVHAEVANGFMLNLDVTVPTPTQAASAVPETSAPPLRNLHDIYAKSSAASSRRSAAATAKPTFEIKRFAFTASEATRQQMLELPVDRQEASYEIPIDIWLSPQDKQDNSPQRFLKTFTHQVTLTNPRPALRYVTIYHLTAQEETIEVKDTPLRDLGAIGYSGTSALQIRYRTPLELCSLSNVTSIVRLTLTFDTGGATIAALPALTTVKSIVAGNEHDAPHTFTVLNDERSINLTVHLPRTLQDAAGVTLRLTFEDAFLPEGEFVVSLVPVSPATRPEPARLMSIGFDYGAAYSAAATHLRTATNVIDTVATPCDFLCTSVAPTSRHLMPSVAAETAAVAYGVGGVWSSFQIGGILEYGASVTRTVKRTVLDRLHNVGPTEEGGRPDDADNGAAEPTPEPPNLLEARLFKVQMAELTCRAFGARGYDRVDGQLKIGLAIPSSYSMVNRVRIAYRNMATEAMRRAGLNIRDDDVMLIDESYAALIGADACHLAGAAPSWCAVIDFGGSTLDCSLWRIDGPNQAPVFAAMSGQTWGSQDIDTLLQQKLQPGAADSKANPAFTRIKIALGDDAVMERLLQDFPDVGVTAATLRAEVRAKVTDVLKNTFKALFRFAARLHSGWDGTDPEHLCDLFLPTRNRLCILVAGNGSKLYQYEDCIMDALAAGDIMPTHEELPAPEILPRDGYDLKACTALGLARLVALVHDDARFQGDFLPFDVFVANNVAQMQQVGFAGQTHGADDTLPRGMIRLTIDANITNNIKDIFIRTCANAEDILAGELDEALTGGDCFFYCCKTGTFCLTFSPEECDACPRR